METEFLENYKKNYWNLLLTFLDWQIDGADFRGVWRTSKSQLVVNIKLGGGLFMIFWNCPKSCPLQPANLVKKFLSFYKTLGCAMLAD